VTVNYLALVDTTVFVIAVIVFVFAGDLARRWWRENEWKRRWKRGRGEDDER